jgi:hypothetical protein
MFMSAISGGIKNSNSSLSILENLSNQQPAEVSAALFDLIKQNPDDLQLQNIVSSILEQEHLISKYDVLKACSQVVLYKKKGQQITDVSEQSMLRRIFGIAAEQIKLSNHDYDHPLSPLIHELEKIPGILFSADMLNVSQLGLQATEMLQTCGVDNYDLTTHHFTA